MSALRLLPLALALAPLAGPSAAEPLGDAFCGDQQRIDDALTRREGAAITGQGLRDPESLMQLWQSGDGGWALVVSYADGRSCIVAMGDAWEATVPPS